MEKPKNVFAAVLALGLIMTLASLPSPVQASSEPKFLKFPDGFKWCVSTAAHQVEGSNINSDWWDFEQLPGAIKNGDKSGLACDHWNRLEEDTRLLVDLNVKQYRFSIEWAKIEPAEGQWDWAAVDHYRREIALLRENGIEPMITLHHFTLPRWVAAHGGFEWDGIAPAFERYTRFVYSAIGEGVRDWITINEPLVLVSGGYLAGLIPPRKQDVKAAAGAIRGMLKCHAAAYHALHELAGDAPVRVGVANHLRVFDPKTWSPLDLVAARILDQLFNWMFPEALSTGRFKMSIPFALNIDERIPGLADTQDFVGVNYYSRDLVRFILKAPFFDRLVRKHAPTNDLGWEIYPKGFYRVLEETAERFPGRPILITENGIADHADDRRVKFLDDHLAQLHRAIERGIPVEAYCHWSIMDNFEWNEGFAPRFGLYEVDYEHDRARIPRESARHFSRIAADNGLIYPSP